MALCPVDPGLGMCYRQVLVDVHEKPARTRVGSYAIELPKDARDDLRNIL